MKLHNTTIKNGEFIPHTDSEVSVNNGRHTIKSNSVQKPRKHLNRKTGRFER